MKNMHLNGTLLLKKYGLSYFKPNIRVLEIAPFGGFPSYMSRAVNDDSIEWWGLDISDDYIGDHKTKEKFILTDSEYEYPIEDNFFDIVISDQVIAHVKLFWVWMEELKRIVDNNGYIITIGSLSYPKCPSPVDCWRIYPDGMKALNDFLSLKTVLSISESLEFEYFGYSAKYNKIPNFRVEGESIATTNTEKPKLLYQNKIKIFYNKLLMHFPLIRTFMNPVRVACDTITIAQKL